MTIIEAVRASEASDPLLSMEIRRKCWTENIRLGLGADSFYLIDTNSQDAPVRDPAICIADVLADDWETFDPYTSEARALRPISTTPAPNDSDHG